MPVCLFRYKISPLIFPPKFTMLNLTTVAPWLQNPGVYGPVTATLDWCEVSTAAALAC